MTAGTRLLYEYCRAHSHKNNLHFNDYSLKTSFKLSLKRLSKIILTLIEFVNFLLGAFSTCATCVYQRNRASFRHTTETPLPLDSLWDIFLGSGKWVGGWGGAKNLNENLNCCCTLDTTDSLILHRRQCAKKNWTDLLRLCDIYWTVYSLLKG